MEEGGVGLCVHTLPMCTSAPVLHKCVPLMYLVVRAHTCA